MMNTPISRRRLLQILATAAGGAGLLGLQRYFSSAIAQTPADVVTPQVSLPLVAKTEPTATPTRTPTVTRTPTATPSRTPTPSATNAPPALAGRIIHVHSGTATSWTGQANYWDYVNHTKVDDMVDQGLMALTGQSSVAEAWQVLMPNYQAGHGIAVKVSFNNSLGTDGSNLIDGIIQPVNALVRGLKSRGVAESDVWVYDATRVLPDRFVNGCQYSGVRFFDNGVRETAGFSSNDPNAYVTFHPPSGVPMPPSARVTDVIINARYLINMPIMKIHSIATTGVSLGFKHHWGTIDNPSGLHDYIMLSRPYRRSNYNALVDVYRNPHIGSKTVLTVADGLFGSFDYARPPSMWSSFGNRPPNSLLFATDPVAIDCVMCDLLQAEKDLLEETDSYLQLAHQAGLGVYERGDPWGTGYSQISYTKIER